MKNNNLTKNDSNVVQLSNFVKKGDTFGKIMSPYLTTDLINKIFTHSKQDFYLNRIRENQTYHIILKDSSFYKFQYEIDSKGFYEIVLNGYDIQSKIILYEFDRDTVFTSIQINSMLYENVIEKQLDPLLAIKLSNVFAWDVDFTYDIKSDDQFLIYYEKLYRENEYQGIGNIISTKYVSNKDTLSIYRYHTNGKPEYFNDLGQNLKKKFLKAPVDFSRISSGFSYKRFHPILKRYKGHFGIDYAADKNTPVYAIADGKVVYSGFKKYNGNYVHIRHNGGFESKYLHFNSIGPGIKKNVKVKQGDIIGYIGKTGLATGYHVCFRFYLNGYPYNFTKVENPITTKLDSTQFYEFKNEINQYPYFFTKDRSLIDSK